MTEHTVEAAIADIAAGRAVVVVDDADRENEGDLIFAAEKATPELVAFMCAIRPAISAHRCRSPTATASSCRRCTTPIRTAAALPTR